MAEIATIPNETPLTPAEPFPIPATVPNGGNQRPRGGPPETLFTTEKARAARAAQIKAKAEADAIAAAARRIVSSPDIPQPSLDADYTEQRLYQVRMRIQALETELVNSIDDTANVARLAQAIERYQDMECDLASRPARPRGNTGSNFAITSQHAGARAGAVNQAGQLTGKPAPIPPRGRLKSAPPPKTEPAQVPEIPPAASPPPDGATTPPPAK